MLMLTKDKGVGSSLPCCFGSYIGIKKLLLLGKDYLVGFESLSRADFNAISMSRR